MNLTEFRKLEKILGHPPREHEVRKAKKEKEKLLTLCPN